jgi:hypothetical protein
MVVESVMLCTMAVSSLKSQSKEENMNFAAPSQSISSSAMSVEAAVEVTDFLKQYFAHAEGVVGVDIRRQKNLLWIEIAVSRFHEDQIRHDLYAKERTIKQALPDMSLEFFLVDASSAGMISAVDAVS